jgi:hypothetical protein
MLQIVEHARDAVWKPDALDSSIAAIILSEPGMDGHLA